jgi:hypothetical protein
VEISGLGNGTRADCTYLAAVPRPDGRHAGYQLRWALYALSCITLTEVSILFVLS